MEFDTDTLETMGRTTLPYAKLLFETYLQPVFSETLYSLKRKRGLGAKIKKALHEYMSDAYAKCAYVSTIAFQNSCKPLLDIYVPLELIKEDDQSEIVVDEKCGIFDICSSVLIVDNAGMGKSIIARRLALECLLKQSAVPVVVDLRSFAEDSDLVNDLLSALALADVCGPEILSTLPLLLVFDGLDEVPLTIRKKATKAIMKVRKVCPKAPALVTSRPDPCTRLLRGFRAFSIKPLSDVKAFALLKKYDNNGILSRKLVSGIEADRDGHIQGFLTTPLYVSLLYCAYRFKPVLPRRKHLFYSEVYDALFETHDLSKEPGFIHQKYSGLDSADFHSVLRRLSFWCLSHDLRLEFPKDELELILRRMGEAMPGVHFGAGEFIKDLVETVPLFIREGSRLRWSHKALMEYFAAMFICHDAKDSQAQVLRKMYSRKAAPSYLSVLELCADIDYATFRKVIVGPLLGRMLQHSTRVSRAVAKSRISNRDKDDRAGLTFDRKFVLYVPTATDPSSEEFSEILSRVESHLPEIGSSTHNSRSSDASFSSMVSITMGEGRSIKSVVGVVNGMDTAILRFLEDKEPGLFSHRADKKDRSTPDGSKAFRTQLPPDTLLLVDTKPSNQVNSKRYFRACNNLMRKVESVWPDVTAARRIHDSISRDKTGGLAELVGDFT